MERGTLHKTFHIVSLFNSIHRYREKTRVPAFLGREQAKMSVPGSDAVSCINSWESKARKKASEGWVAWEESFLSVGLCCSCRV